MSVAASAIISRVRTQVIDLGLSGPLRWTDTELLQWLSDGQRTVVAALPRASQTTVIQSLLAGTRQLIPANGYTYLTAYRNFAADGVTPGPAFEKVPRSLMDTQYPAWHQATPVPAPIAVMFDPSDPMVFYVSPPSDGTGKVELSYAISPPDMVTTADLLVVDDIYETPLFDYVMFRVCQKDSDYSGGQAVAATYMTAFEGFISGQMKDPLSIATQQAQT